MQTFKIWRECLFKPSLRHPLLLFASLGGIAAGTGVLCALNLANERALKSFEASAQGMGLGRAQETRHSVQWRSPTGRIPIEELGACLAEAPSGLRCRGVRSSSLQTEGRTVQIIGVDGGLESVGAPVFSSALANETSVLKSGEVRAASIVPGNDFFVVLDFPDAIRWIGDALPAYDWIEAEMEEGASPEQFERSLMAVEKGFRSRLRRTSAAHVFDSQRALTSTYRFNLNVLGLMSILVGALLVANVSALYLLIKKPTVGVLRQLGCSRPQVLGLIFLEQSILGILGGCLGLGVGLALEGLVSGQVLHTLSSLYLKTVATRSELTVRTALLVIFSGWAIYVFAGLASTFALVRQAPAGLTRRVQAEKRSRKWPWAIAAFCLAWIFLSPRFPPMRLPGLDLPQPVAGYLAAGLIFVLAYALASQALISIGRVFEWLTPSRVAETLPSLAVAARRSRHSGTRGRAQVATLAGGLGLVVGTHLMVGGFKETLGVWLNQAFQAEIAALPSRLLGTEARPRIDENQLQTLRNLKTVEGVDCMLQSETEFRGRPVKIAGVEDALLPDRPVPLLPLDFPPGQTDREALLQVHQSRNLALVSETFSNKFGVRRGDSIEIDLVGRGHLTALRIQGVLREYSSEAGYVLVSRELVQVETGLDGCHSLRLYARGGLPAVQAELKIRDAKLADSLGMVSSQALKSNAMKTFDETFAVTGVLSILSAILGGLSLLTQLIQSTSERKPEWLALRRLGATRVKLLKLCGADIFLSVLTGGFLGVGCGSLLGWVLCRSINLQAFGWSVGFGSRAAWITVIWMSSAFVLLLWGIGIILSWWVLRPSLGWRVQRE